MVQPFTIQRFDFFALQDFVAPVVVDELLAQSEVVEIAPPPPAPPMYSEEELERAKRMAFDQGVAEGVQRGRQDDTRMRIDADQQLAQQMGIIAERLQQAKSIFAQAVEAERDTMQALAFAIAQKLALQALKENSMAVLEAMLEYCLPHILTQPALLVRVNPDDKLALEARLADLAQLHSFEGVLTVRSDDALQHGDIRIDWQFGTAERRLQYLIDEMKLLLPTLKDNEGEAENIFQLHPAHPIT